MMAHALGLSAASALRVADDAAWSSPASSEADRGTEPSGKNAEIVRLPKPCLSKLRKEREKVAEFQRRVDVLVKAAGPRGRGAA